MANNRKNKITGRPKVLRALDPPTTDLFTITSPPPANIVRKCSNLFGKNGGYHSPPVLGTNKPIELLSSTTVVMNYVRRTSGSNSVLIRDLYRFFVQHGGLIITNDPGRRIVFDRKRFHQLALLQSSGSNSLESGYDRQKRLLQLLGLAAKETFQSTMVTAELPALDLSANDQALTPLAADDVRTFVGLAGEEALGSLAATYPVLEPLVKNLALLGVHSAKGREHGITETIDEISRLLHSFRDKVDDDALRVIDEFSRDAPAGQVPTQDITAQQIESQVRLLNAAKEPFKQSDTLLSRLLREANDLLE